MSVRWYKNGKKKITKPNRDIQNNGVDHDEES